MLNKELATKEILEAINTFSSEVDKQFAQVKGEINNIKATMLTKDYLDSKLFDLRGDIISVIRKEDAKMAKLIDILQKRDIINSEDVKVILSMEPFPQLFI